HQLWVGVGLGWVVEKFFLGMGFFFSVGVFLLVLGWGSRGFFLFRGLFPDYFAVIAFFDKWGVYLYEGLPATPGGVGNRGGRNEAK
ncbi:hypothetical protein AAGG49_21985, partial [Stenotrophomonas maltophilia]|uniref:hypothetical protein n=1 Tax=Stenotrophomonas maltophilia TaxID=40324 RepID=UPI00313BB400